MFPFLRAQNISMSVNFYVFFCYYVFVLCIFFCSVPLPTSTAEFSLGVPGSRCLSSMVPCMHIQDPCTPENQHLSHPVLVHFHLHQTREMWDIVPGIPEPFTCLKSKLKFGCTYGILFNRNPLSKINSLI